MIGFCWDRKENQDMIEVVSYSLMDSLEKLICMNISDGLCCKYLQILVQILMRCRSWVNNHHHSRAYCALNTRVYGCIVTKNNDFMQFPAKHCNTVCYQPQQTNKNKELMPRHLPVTCKWKCIWMEMQLDLCLILGYEDNTRDWTLHWYLWCME